MYLLSPLILAALSQPAAAGAWLGSVTTPVEIGEGGNWARMVDRPDGGWYFLNASGGDYYVQEMAPDYSLDTGTRRGLTGETTLVDHSFAACADGTFVHVASANLDDFDDSAYIFTYDAELVELDRETIAERDSAHLYNDAPLVCTEDWIGAPFQPEDEDGSEGTDLTGPFRIFDRALSLERTLEFGAYPAVGGSSFVVEDDGTLAWIRAYLLTPSFQVERFEDPGSYGSGVTELDLIETHEIALDEALSGFSGVAYWPQSTLRIGDYYVVAVIAASPDEPWSTGSGNLWLVVLDSDWSVVEGLQITDISPGNGAIQPFMHWRDGSTTLRVLYSQEVQPKVVEVGLNASAFGFSPSSTTAPVANAGPDAEVERGETAILDGTGSSDADGDTLSYSWSILEMPGGSSASLADAESATASFVVDAPGLYVVRLTVDDGAYSDFDDVTISGIEPTGDGGSSDGGSSDGGSSDGGSSDGGSSDGGSSDGGSSDGGSGDGGSGDGGSSDGGSGDGGSGDGGSEDGGAIDGGDDTGGEGKDEGCGCMGGGSAGASLVGLLLPLLAVRRRRA